MNSPNWIEKFTGSSLPFWKKYFKNNVHLLPKAAWDFQPMISYVWLIESCRRIESLMALATWSQTLFVCLPDNLSLSTVMLKTPCMEQGERR